MATRRITTTKHLPQMNPTLASAIRPFWVGDQYIHDAQVVRVYVWHGVVAWCLLDLKHHTPSFFVVTVPSSGRSFGGFPSDAEGNQGT